LSDALEWIGADWPAPPGILAGCTTRIGGVSQDEFAALNLGVNVGDDPTHVAENRRLMTLSCGLANEPVWLDQVHGTHVVVDPGPVRSLEADAVVSTRSDAVCAIMVADCLPVLFVSENGEEVGAAHAGWRGLCNGVLEVTIEAFRAPAESLLVWLGPTISQEHFEVGDEVRDAFIEHDRVAAQCFTQNVRGRWQADLCSLAEQRLHGLGVRQIYGGGMCTFSDPQRFFSYRRSGQCGRMAAIIARRSV
jgi:YfiH family protein